MLCRRRWASGSDTQQQRACTASLLRDPLREPEVSLRLPRPQPRVLPPCGLPAPRSLHMLIQLLTYRSPHHRCVLCAPAAGGHPGSRGRGSHCKSSSAVSNGTSLQDRRGADRRSVWRSSGAGGAGAAATIAVDMGAAEMLVPLLGKRGTALPAAAALARLHAAAAPPSRARVTAAPGLLTKLLGLAALVSREAREGAPRPPTVT